jgi:hypothetical protein
MSLDVSVALTGQRRFMIGDPGRRSRTRLPRAVSGPLSGERVPRSTPFPGDIRMSGMITPATPPRFSCLFAFRL